MAPKSDEQAEEMQRIPYQSAIGSLMYAMLGTRPDIAYAVGATSRYCSNPGPSHWVAVKRIFRYLKGTMNHELEYKGQGQLIGYTDADWAGDIDDRRSTTGYTFIVGGGSVTWNSRKQQTVALSTTEAEYMSLAEAAKEATWIRTFLFELGFGPVENVATRIYSDNQGCIALSKKPTYHSRTKHIDVRYHFIRDAIENGTFDVIHISTDDMVADVLTKGLSREKHCRFKEEMGLKG
jgi:hypothetical protein